MVTSDAATPQAYLDELPEERRADVAAMRDLVNANLPEDVAEVMRYGMIAWEVPLEVSGPTTNGQPVAVAALAAQKHRISLYLSAIYVDDDVSRRFEEAWRASGKRLDRGKSCVRFRTFADVPADVVASTVAAIDLDDLVARSDRP